MQLVKELVKNTNSLFLVRGYDHNFVLDNKEEVDATVYEPVSGRMLEVITDQPGMQLYTGNFLDGTTNRSWRKTI